MAFLHPVLNAEYTQRTKSIIPSLAQLPNKNIKTQPELVGIGVWAPCHTVSWGMTLQQVSNSAVTEYVYSYTAVTAGQGALAPFWWRVKLIYTFSVASRFKSWLLKSAFITSPTEKDERGLLYFWLMRPLCSDLLCFVAPQTYYAVVTTQPFWKCTSSSLRRFRMWWERES